MTKCDTRRILVAIKDLFLIFVRSLSGPNKMNSKFLNGFLLFLFITLLAACGGSTIDDFTDFTQIWAIGIEDLDLDGVNDIVVTSTKIRNSDQTHLESIILNDLSSPGSFDLTQEIVLNRIDREWPSSVTVGDLNDDGLPDIATQNGNAILISFHDLANPGQFLSPLKITVGSKTESLAIGDLNQDGYNDIAISGGLVHLSILFQDSFNPGNFLALVNLGVKSGSVDIGDLTGDLINDMVVTDGDNGRVIVLVQNPGIPGNFTIAASLATDAWASDVKVDDIDQDGRLDLVVANSGLSGVANTGSVSVLLQDPINAGQFLSAINYAIGCSAKAVSLGDLNKDGFIDIAIASWCQSEAITILFQENAGIGTFLPPVRYSTDELNPWKVEIGDMNNDNYNDLIISENGLVIRYQNPAIPGSFFGRTVIYDPD